MATGTIKTPIVIERGTSDVLADALSAQRTTIYKGVGSSYTGNIPNNNLAYGIFVVFVRTTDRFVLGFDVAGNEWFTVYNGSSWTNWEKLNTTITSLSTTKSSNVTGDVSADRAGHVFNIRIDITFSTVGGGWNEVATLPFSPSHNYYGVVSTTGGACKLAIVTYTGKVQILAPSANTEYLGTITGIVE